MSSHHIVREKQEPALLVLGTIHFTDELLGQLLEWSPTVVVTADTAEKLNAAGIKIDVVIGSSGVGEDLQSDVRFIRASDNNETATALSYLVEHNYPAVNVVTDVFELTDYVAFADRINLVIYYANKKIYPVRNGFSKWKPAGETITILNPEGKIATEGLEQTADNSYITVRDGIFSLQFEQPNLFIAENIL